MINDELLKKDSAAWSWLASWMNGWTDRWVDGQAGRQVGRQMCRYTYVCMDGWIDGQIVLYFFNVK